MDSKYIGGPAHGFPVPTRLLQVAPGMVHSVNVADFANSPTLRANAQHLRPIHDRATPGLGEPTQYRVTVLAYYRWVRLGEDWHCVFQGVTDERALQLVREEINFVYFF